MWELPPTKDEFGGGSGGRRRKGRDIGKCPGTATCVDDNANSHFSVSDGAASEAEDSHCCTKACPGLIGMFPGRWWERRRRFGGIATLSLVIVSRSGEWTQSLFSIFFRRSNELETNLCLNARLHWCRTHLMGTGPLERITHPPKRCDLA